MKEVFNFQPLKRKKKIETDIYVRINKPGVLYFPQCTLWEIGRCMEPVFIKIMCDIEKRAIGFSFIPKIELKKGTEIRMLKPTKRGSSVYAVVSIRPFIQALGGKVSLPTGRLPLKKYSGGILDDSDIYYTIVPLTKNYENNN